jgi:hypothetical protein
MNKPLDKNGIFDTLQSINHLLGPDQRLKEVDLIELFESVWARKLGEQLASIPSGEQVEPRKPEDILEEILELVRGSGTRLNERSTDPLDGAKLLNGLRYIAGPNGMVSRTGNEYLVRVPSADDVSNLDKEYLKLLRRDLADGFGIDLIHRDDEGEVVLYN